MREEVEKALEDSEISEIYDKHSGITFRIPENFVVNEEKGEIYRITKDGMERISANLILITGIIHNLDDVLQ